MIIQEECRKHLHYSEITACVLYAILPNLLKLCFLVFLISVRQLFECSTACHLIQKKLLCYSQVNKSLLPRQVRQKYTKGIYSWNEMRQPCLYFKGSEGVFECTKRTSLSVTCCSDCALSNSDVSVNSRRFFHHVTNLCEEIQAIQVYICIHDVFRLFSLHGTYQFINIRKAHQSITLNTRKMNTLSSKLFWHWMVTVYRSLGNICLLQRWNIT